MKLENHLKKFEEHIDGLEWGIRQNNHSSVGFHASQGAIEMVSIYLHRMNLITADIQLKHDVVRIGTVAEGIGLYRFQYNWSDQVYVGVIAQEVQAARPDAVVRGHDGYLRVDYGAIGAPFQTWERWTASGGATNH